MSHYKPPRKKTSRDAWQGSVTDQGEWKLIVISLDQQEVVDTLEKYLSQHPTEKVEMKQAPHKARWK